MRKFFGTAGFLMMLMGISGAINEIWRQPFLGLFLNQFDRFITRMELFTGYEVFANLIFAFLGVIVAAAAGRAE
jgi:hypothetical protein